MKTTGHTLIDQDVNQHVVDWAVQRVVAFRDEHITDPCRPPLGYLPRGTRRFVRLTQPGMSTDIGGGEFFELPLKCEDWNEIVSLCGKWGIEIPSNLIQK